MRKRLLFVLVFSFIATVSLSAQMRTITNDDLEKYRQKRLVAERDLRENYERLGFPSPEELQKQIEQSRVERTALSKRLSAENFERERLNLERRRAESEARSRDFQIQNQTYAPRVDNNFSNYAPNGFFSFPNFGYPNNRYHRRGYGNGYRRYYEDQPRIEYRNNLPVVVEPAPQVIFAPRPNNGGRRN